MVTGLYAALVEYLENKELIRWGPFDAAPCGNATLDDLDFERMTQFVRTARQVRQFPLAEGTPPRKLLEHLNLLNEGRLTNAAVLLFGKAPQRFLISSEIRCAHFHGTEVAKPIPSYQVYKGTAFDMVDQAVDFVLSKIDRAIGTRAESARAPRTYEIPVEVVTEAIVNAVAHRDYTDNGSVQVMLFADRLEVRNPGRLPPPLTLEKLREAHRSVPGNPLLAESLYLAEYIERMGTGTKRAKPGAKLGAKLTCQGRSLLCFVRAVEELSPATSCGLLLATRVVPGTSAGGSTASCMRGCWK